MNGNFIAEVTNFFVNHHPHVTLLVQYENAPAKHKHYVYRGETIGFPLEDVPIVISIHGPKSLDKDYFITPPKGCEYVYVPEVEKSAPKERSVRGKIIVKKGIPKWKLKVKRPPASSLPGDDNVTVGDEPPV